MLKVLTVVCLLGLAGLAVSGGCTPAAKDAWSSDLDFSDMDPRLGEEMDGYYDVFNNLDGRFYGLTLYQTGGTFQGYDNMGRSWSGTISGQHSGSDGTYSGQVNLQTNDGGQQAIIMANTVVIVIVDAEGNEICYKGIVGVFYYGDSSGQISLVGWVVPCEMPGD